MSDAWDPETDTLHKYVSPEVAAGGGVCVLVHVCVQETTTSAVEDVWQRKMCGLSVSLDR